MTDSDPLCDGATEEETSISRSILFIILISPPTAATVALPLQDRARVYRT